MVKWENAITRKGRKCTNLVIEKYRYNKNKDSLPIYLRSESLFFVC